MERMLQKLARQLDSLDEASLMDLWGKYATIASRFEPTEQWEEACLIFSLIQAKHWKNQLFNYYWSQQKTPQNRRAVPVEKVKNNLNFDLEKESPDEQIEPVEKCQILAFKPIGPAKERG